MCQSMLSYPFQSILIISRPIFFFIFNIFFFISFLHFTSLFKWKKRVRAMIKEKMPQWYTPIDQNNKLQKIHIYDGIWNSINNFFWHLFLTWNSFWHLYFSIIKCWCVSFRPSFLIPLKVYLPSTIAIYVYMIGNIWSQVDFYQSITYYFFLI